MNAETMHMAAATELPHDLTVLVVEPQKFLSGILRNALVTAGVFTDNIHEVQSAAQAQEALTSKIPDIVLTELNLPDMNGEAFIRLIRQRGVDVPIVALSSEPFEYKVRAAIAAGANDFLAKPISQLLLSKRIARQLLHVALTPDMPESRPEQPASHFSL